MTVTNKEKKTSSTTDSQTKADLKVNLRLSGGRDRITIRMKPELKQAFSEFCTANDLTECHVLEALISAWLTGVGQKIKQVSLSPTIELTVVREVKRVRRYSHIDSGVEGGANFFLEDPGIWIHKDGELNVNGHVGGCKCLLCRRRK